MCSAKNRNTSGGSYIYGKQIYFAQGFDKCYKKISFICLPIVKRGKNIMEKIVSLIFKDNM